MQRRRGFDRRRKTEEPKTGSSRAGHVGTVRPIAYISFTLRSYEHFYTATMQNALAPEVSDRIPVSTRKACDQVSKRARLSRIGPLTSA